MRLLARVALAILMAILVPTAAAGLAHAESYRYWGYYQWTDGGWDFASVGPADTVPEDGAVEGWRFAVGDESTTRFPRTGDVFNDVCGEADAADGHKRVAVVLDYGTDDDAPDGDEPPSPRGECAVVPDDATGADILASVAEVRAENGMTCGVDGYPSTECAATVDGAAPNGEEQTVDLALAGDAEDTEAADDSGTSGSQIALIIGIAAVVLIGAAALVRMRR